MPLIAMLLVLLGSSSGTSSKIHDFDVMELNHSLVDDGKMVIDQVILRDWSPDYRRWDVQHWIFLDALEMVPECNKEGRFECRHHDGKTMHIFRAKIGYETWTVGDQERANQKLLCPNMRRRVDLE